ncbi:DUF4255 domain-containing protein [Mycolicibacterium celeriflavum]|uniref:DUF4255 domain-containing protein n=1 Tax=Mycolicibacterium celeriflavum TaxID=1249101 RepID=UPI003CF355B2
MSNGLAIAGVTSALRFLLDRSLQQPHPGPVGGGRVTTRHPRRLTEPDTTPEPMLNVFLYQVTPNHAWNLADLPTRNGDGTLTRRPVAALDLHYLISCQGQDESLDAQRLLGRAVLALATTPVLTRDVLTDAIAAYETDPETTFLTDVDLADQVELVKVSSTVMSADEMSKLWSVLLQTPYLLSVTYTATVVLIEADVTPRSALPVRFRNLTVTAGGPPVLAGLRTEPPDSPVTEGTDLVLSGSNLVGPNTFVRIGSALLAPTGEPTAQQIRVTVDASVAAGLHGAQVLHRSVPGVAPARTLAASNAVPLLVRPTVTVGAVTPAEFSLTLNPPLAIGQRVSVTLTTLPGQPGPSQAVTVQLAPAAVAQPTLTIARGGIPNGTWLVRVQVDGVDSHPELVGDTYAEPALALT